MRRRLRLSLQAWHDLEAIEDYTLREWGEVQARAYIYTFHQTFQILVENPSIGRTTDAAVGLYRMHPVGNHLIIYRHNDSVVEILNILHQAMDIEKRLADALARKKPRKSTTTN